MRELISLRAENRRLYTERTPVLPDDLADLTEGTPLKLHRSNSGDGRWAFSLDLGGSNKTGGESYETPRQAFIAALEHVRTYISRMEADYAEE